MRTSLIKDAIALHIESLRAHGEPVPGPKVPLAISPFSYVRKDGPSTVRYRRRFVLASRQGTRLIRASAWALLILIDSE